MGIHGALNKGSCRKFFKAWVHYLVDVIEPGSRYYLKGYSCLGLVSLWVNCDRLFIGKRLNKGHHLNLQLDIQVWDPWNLCYVEVLLEVSTKVILRGSNRLLEQIILLTATATKSS